MDDIEIPDGWALDGESLVKRYEFPNFTAAMGFMAVATPEIDELDHHPEWSNVYNKVDVRLTSHDVGTVTERDLRLAAILDGIAAKQG